MIKFIIIYMIIGILWMLVLKGFEYLVFSHKEEFPELWEELDKENEIFENPFTSQEMVVAGITWPLSIMIFVISFIKAL